MISRRVLVYLLAAACTVLGLRMMFDGDPDDAEGSAPTPGTLVGADAPSRLPGNLGGYRGTGQAQVQFEDAPRTVAQPAVVQEGAEVRSPRKAASERRMEELKRVLANIDNEPVYVEGVDGPAPAKAPPPKR
jgi:hypothetical protein